MRNGQLTPRQQLFAQHYALTGKAGKSAIAAGCTPKGARTRAYHWLRKIEIQERIRKIQAKEFRVLKRKVELEAAQLVYQSLTVKRGSIRKGTRALRLLYRLGVLPNDPFAGERETRQEPSFSNH